MDKPIKHGLTFTVNIFHAPINLNKNCESLVYLRMKLFLLDD